MHLQNRASARNLIYSKKSRALRGTSYCEGYSLVASAAPAIPHDGAFVRHGHHVLVFSAAAALRARICFAKRRRTRTFVSRRKIRRNNDNNEDDQRRPR